MLLFQSIRELLMNVVKHAGTKHAGITITVDEGQLEITVTDGGVGFLHTESSTLPTYGTAPIRSLQHPGRMLALGTFGPLLPTRSRHHCHAGHAAPRHA